jgi:acetyl-CoA synthetase
MDSECKMVITSDVATRGNKTIALKEIIDEALEKCTSVEKVLVKPTPGNDERGQRYLFAAAIEASDNSVAEIMDSEDPLFIFIPMGQQENRKEWYILPPAIWFTQLILLKTYSEKTTLWCTADIVG